MTVNPQLTDEEIRRALRTMKQNQPQRYNIFVRFCHAYEADTDSEINRTELGQKMGLNQGTVSERLNEAFGELKVPIGRKSALEPPEQEARSRRLAQISRIVKAEIPLELLPPLSSKPPSESLPSSDPPKRIAEQQGPESDPAKEKQQDPPQPPPQESSPKQKRENILNQVDAGNATNGFLMQLARQPTTWAVAAVGLLVGIVIGRLVTPTQPLVPTTAGAPSVEVTRLIEQTVEVTREVLQTVIVPQTLVQTSPPTIIVVTSEPPPTYTPPPIQLISTPIPVVFTETVVVTAVATQIVVVTSPPIVITATPLPATDTPQLPTPSPSPEPTKAPESNLVDPSGQPHIFEAGESARNQGVEFALLDVRFGTNTMVTHWKLTNNTGKQIPAKLNPDSFTIVDNLGRKYSGQLPWIHVRGDCDGFDRLLEPGEFIFNGNCKDNGLITNFSTSDCQIKEMMITVSDTTARIPKATWKVKVDLC